MNRTQEEVAKALGVTRSTYAYWETDKNDPDSKTVRTLADYYKTTTDYLLGRSTFRDQLPIGAIPETGMVKIPVLGKIRAGEPLLCAENVIDYQYVQEATVKNGEHFFLQVTGDSMAGARIFPGDLVLVRRQSDVDDGEIAVILIDGEEATLKRLYRQNGHLILQSENAKYPPKVISQGDVKVLGKVIKVQFDLE